MDQSAIVMSDDTEGNTRTNRGLQLPSCFSSWPASALSVFCIGLLSGAVGGLLLGETAVVALQSLEILADNRLLMEQLENYIMGFLRQNNNSSKKQDMLEMTRDEEEYVHNISINLLFEEFGVFSSTLSLPVGLFIGLSTYKLVINRYGEAAMEKALALAGSVCLMGITASGFFVGQSLEGFLLIFSQYLERIFWIFTGFMCFLGIMWCIFGNSSCCRGNCEVLSTRVSFLFIYCWVKMMTFFFGMVFPVLIQTKLILVLVLLPSIGFVNVWLNVQLTITPVPLMLLITDVFNIARHPIVTLQSATNTSSAVVEGMFVGVLTSQLLMVVIGMSLFLSWHKGGATKICATAAASGGAILAVVKSVLPVLGPGPTIGALMGVSGAVGVSLSAAGAATDQYGQTVDRHGLVGRLGVTVGAGVGAFLSSSTNSGLSWVFMGLCGAVIPAGPDLQLLFLLVERSDRLCKVICTVIVILFLPWVCFTITMLGAILFGWFLLDMFFLMVLMFFLDLCTRVQCSRVGQTI